MLRQLVKGSGLVLVRRSLATSSVGPGHSGNKCQAASGGFFSNFFEPKQIQVQVIDKYLLPLKRIFPLFKACPQFLIMGIFTLKPLTLGEYRV